VGVVLTASGGSNYTWSPATGLSGTTGPTVTANPSSTTTYTVTEGGSGCNNYATVTVGVGPSVSASASVTPTNGCPGTTVNLTSSATQSQQVLFSETFESGNSLTLVNGSQRNKWYRGTNNKCNGSYSLYVSDGTSWYYNPDYGTTSRVHAYFDVAIPAGATNVTLSFNWKCRGESNYDDLKVFSCTNTVVPAAGSTLSTGPNVVLIGTYQGSYSSCNLVTSDQSAYVGYYKEVHFSMEK